MPDPLKDPKLVCYGCAFSASEGAYPGQPCEWVCLTCSRNPEVRKNGVDPQRAEVMRKRGQNPIPADLYRTMDLFCMIRDVDRGDMDALDKLADRASELPDDLRQLVLGRRVARRLLGGG